MPVAQDRIMGAPLDLPGQRSLYHVRGDLAAPIVLLEFGDYQCPRCGAAHPIVEAIRRHFGRQLRFVFRHFPLVGIHPRAHRAAEVGEAAGVQSRFWDMHDMLFEHQDEVQDDDLLLYAAELGIDAGRCARELAEGTHRWRVREDLVSGLQIGVTTPPTFFINGVRHIGGYGPASLLVAIEQMAMPPVSTGFSPWSGETAIFRNRVGAGDGERRLYTATSRLADSRRFLRARLTGSDRRQPRTIAGRENEDATGREEPPRSE